MHTFTGNKAVIHYNADMSGDCNIINRDTGQIVSVPCDDILSFVAEFIRSEKIGKIEAQDFKDILGI